MKTIKIIIYTIVISFFFSSVAMNIFYNVVIDDLNEYSQLNIDRNTLYDTALICSQLYFMNPNMVNQLTCKKITNKIVVLDNKLEEYYLVRFYLSAIK